MVSVEFFLLLLKIFVMSLRTNYVRDVVAVPLYKIVVFDVPKAEMHNGLILFAFYVPKAQVYLVCFRTQL